MQQDCCEFQSELQSDPVTQEIKTTEREREREQERCGWWREGRRGTRRTFQISQKAPWGACRAAVDLATSGHLPPLPHQRPQPSQHAGPLTTSASTSLINHPKEALQELWVKSWEVEVWGPTLGLPSPSSALRTRQNWISRLLSRPGGSRQASCSFPCKGSVPAQTEFGCGGCCPGYSRPMSFLTDL